MEHDDCLDNRPVLPRRKLDDNGPHRENAYSELFSTTVTTVSLTTQPPPLVIEIYRNSYRTRCRHRQGP
jgi:hypothetical protein